MKFFEFLLNLLLKRSKTAQESKSMQVNELDINEITQRFILHEGCSLMPYICPAGYLTIGIGHNLDENPLTAEEIKICGDSYMKGITKNAAYFIFRKDLEISQNDCLRKIPFYTALDKERKYALLDMCFNMGIKRLLKFKKMLSAMGVGDWEWAYRECLDSDYARQTGKRAKRIAETIRTGKFIV